MNKGKYFYFTIKDDELNVEELKKSANLPCDTYVIGERTKIQFSKEEVFQSTNRWVYKSDSYEDVSINDFLVEQLDVINNHLSVLRSYISKYGALIEYTIYIEEETNTFNMLLNNKIIKMLSKINAEFSLTFIDW